MGFTTVWLSPVYLMRTDKFMGHGAFHGYWVRDIGQVEPRFGTEEQLKQLVDEAHARGLKVLLDVVYNHLGPEGICLRDFGPYFTDFYRTPWGEAINFDGPHNEHVRRYFIANALQWVDEFRIDALRLDAVHAMEIRRG